MSVSKVGTSTTVTLGDTTTTYTNLGICRPEAPPPKVNDSRMSPDEHYAVAGFSGALSVASIVGACFAASAGGIFLLLLMAIGFGWMAKSFYEGGRDADHEKKVEAMKAKPAQPEAARVDLRGTMATGPGAALQPPKVA